MFFQILFASIVGSVFAMVGGVILLWRENFAKRFSLFLVSFAAGSLMGAAFLGLLPEALEEITFDAAAGLVIAGILAIFLFEKLLKWYHCHDQEVCDYHTFSSTVLFGDVIHNFVDGIAIALSFSVGVPVGIATTVAVFFHEVPQEIGDFGVLLHAGYNKTEVFLYNFLAALATPIGAIIGFLLLPLLSGIIGGMVAFIAGTFIYIAVSDLLPELRHKTSGADFGHLASIILGVLIVWALGVFIPE